MKKTDTVRVKMLGNFRDYEVGKVYDLPVDMANMLTGIGYAVIAEDAAPAVEED